MELSNEVVRKVEEHGFSMNEICEQDGEYYVEMGQSTPAGEDWWETIWFDGTNNGFVDGVRKQYEGFDVDEEVEVWINSRGKNGVPSSIRTLVEDAEWKEKTLGELAEALGTLDLEEE